MTDSSVRLTQAADRAKHGADIVFGFSEGPLGGAVQTNSGDLPTLRTWLATQLARVDEMLGLIGQVTLGKRITIPSAGEALALSLALSERAEAFSITLDEPECDITLTNTLVPAGYVRRITLALRQGTGSNLVNWPASIHWAGAEPILSYAASKVDMVELVSLDDGATFIGFFVGQVPAL